MAARIAPSSSSCGRSSTSATTSSMEYFPLVMTCEPVVISGGPRAPGGQGSFDRGTDVTPVVETVRRGRRHHSGQPFVDLVGGGPPRWAVYGDHHGRIQLGRHRDGVRRLIQHVHPAGVET